jgi:hypothetical protein
MFKIQALTVLLVTIILPSGQSFHMPRSLKIFSKKLTSPIPSAGAMNQHVETNKSTAEKDATDLSTSYKILKQDHPASPPYQLMNLQLHKIMTPIKSLPQMQIKRIATNPDIFILSNFVASPEEQVSLIMSAVRQGMDYAGTKSGDVVKQREKSYTSWIDPGADYGITNRTKEDYVSDIDQGRDLARIMTELSSSLFVPENFKGSGWTYAAEPIQTVRYESGGKYDVHHDGYNRFLTVLTYLNGVGGTWFPYAITDPCTEKMIQEEESPPDMTMDRVIADKIPGRDGVLIAGLEDIKGMDIHDSNGHVVKIQPGDAVVFYNYDWIETDNRVELIRQKENVDSRDLPPPSGPLMNWRSIHSGQKTNREKWIATNWFRVVDGTLVYP